MTAVAVAVGCVLAAPRALAVSAERAFEVGWLPAPAAAAPLSKEWLAERYGVRITSLQVEQFTTPAASISIWSLAAADAVGTRKLWTVLERDKTPDQLLARDGDTIHVVVSADAREREKGAALLGAGHTSQSASRFAWLANEMPVQVPGLAFSHARFRHDLMALEKNVGLALDAVYQVDYRLRSGSLARQLTQVAFWVPRAESKIGELARRLPELRPEEQTILTGKGAVVAVLSFNDEGRQRVVEILTSKGYRVESPTASRSTATTTAPK
jgi:hypothetical protein